jgi:uncharacterized protein (TIGR00369 family)
MGRGVRPARSRSLRAVKDVSTGPDASEQPAAAARAEEDATGKPSGNARAHRDGPRSLDGVSSFFGLVWEDPQTVRMRIRPELINNGGLLSGVATYALVDYCMGSTLWVQTTREEHIATINIAINYLQTATEGEIVCRTVLDRRNRTIGIMKSEVRHEDGRLLVTATGSYSIFPARKRPRVAPPAADAPPAAG